MKNYRKTIGALAAASALVAGNASAEIEYQLHTGYTNQYLFRGADLGNNLIEVGADVSTEAYGLNLSAGVWNGTYDYYGYGVTQANETDIYAEVAKDFGFATVGVGYIYYLNQDSTVFPFIGDDDQEVYFSLSRDFGFANTSFTYFWDIEGDNDGYSELALSRSFELSPCLALNVSTNVAFLFDQSEFGAWTTKVALDWGFAERAKLSPFVTLAVGNADVISDNDNELVGGAMLSVGF